MIILSYCFHYLGVGPLNFGKLANFNNENTIISGRN